MPAAAVILAPIAYIKVVAVKKLVVGSESVPGGPPDGGNCRGRDSQPVSPDDLRRLSRVTGTFTLKKLECSEQACYAWIMVHGIMEEDLGSISLVFGTRGND